MRNVRPKNKKDYGAVLRVKLKKIKKNFPVFTLIFSIFTGLYYLSHSNFIQAKVNIINSSDNIHTKKILHDIQYLIKNPLDISAIKHIILAQEWVKNIHIQRVWNTLNITIIPQEIIFNWHNINNTKQGFINADGELFIPKNSVKSDKPTIVSNEEDIKNSFKNLLNYQTTFKEKIDTLMHNNIEIIVLHNGAQIILGQKYQRTRLQKLQKHYDKFIMRPDSIVDLRYPNGFSKTN